MLRKVSTLLDCHIISLDEYVAVCNDVSIETFLTDIEILDINHNLYDFTYYVNCSSKFDNVIKDAVFVPSTSEMQKIIKNMCSYFDVHPNEGMNKIKEDLKQFVDNIGLKNTFFPFSNFLNYFFFQKQHFLTPFLS